MQKSKLIYSFLALESALTLFLFCLSAIGIRSDDLSFCSLSLNSLLIPDLNQSLLDIPLLFMLNTLLIVPSVLTITKYHKSNTLFSRILIHISTWSILALVLAKITISLQTGIKTYKITSFFVYSILFVSAILAVLQSFAVVLKMDTWIKGLDNESADEITIISEVEPAKKTNWKRLLKLLHPNTRYLIIAFTGLLINSASNLGAPYFFGLVVDAVTGKTPDADADMVSDIVLRLFSVFLIGAISAYIRSYYFTLAGYCVVKQLRQDLFRAIAMQDIAYFDTITTGDLLSRLSSDTQVLQNGITVNVSMLIRSLTSAIGCLFILFGISWKLSLVMFSIVPIVVLGAVIYGSYVGEFQNLFQTRLADASSKAQESISQIRTVKAFAKESHAIATYSAEIDKTHAVGIQITGLQAIFMGCVMFFPQASIALVLYSGGILVMKGEMTGGLLYTLTLAFSIGTVSSLYGDAMQTLGASHKIFDIIDGMELYNIDHIPTIPSSGGATLDTFQGRISIKNVNFKYPSRPDANVLVSINLELEPGKTLALVGPSGQGKSTIMALLLRFYDPVSGNILLDNRMDLKVADLKWYRSNIGYVSQEPVLFSGSIRENIAYGWNKWDRPPTDDGITKLTKEIFEAAKKANAHDFIISFPEGYDTSCGERGVRLSGIYNTHQGGQKQRLAIARAFLMDPKILLFDEATSALDSESEHLVQEAIDRAMVGRTVVVIAHRLSTIVGADKIAVIANGSVQEIGSHSELMAKNGDYKRLVVRQMNPN